MDEEFSGLNLYYKCITAIRRYHSGNEPITKHEVEHLVTLLEKNHIKLYAKLEKIFPSIYPGLWPIGTVLKGKDHLDSSYQVKKIRWDRYILTDLSGKTSDVHFTFDGAHTYLRSQPRIIK